jgi:GABA(A) receptor-associated protein
MKFKSQHTFQARFEEATRIMNKYPERIPIICEKSIDKKNSDLPTIDKAKYLVPIDLTISQFLFVIRNRMKLPAEKAIFLFVGGTIPSGSALLYNIYSQYKDADRFLYITYSGENVFG